MSSPKRSAHPSCHAITHPDIWFRRDVLPDSPCSPRSSTHKLTLNTVYRPAETLDTRLDKMERMLNNVHPPWSPLLYVNSNTHHRHSQEGTTTSIREARAAQVVSQIRRLLHPFHFSLLVPPPKSTKTSCQAVIAKLRP